MVHERLAYGFLRDDALGRALEGVELVVAVGQVVEGGDGVRTLGVNGFAAERGALQLAVGRDDQAGRAAHALAAYGCDIVEEGLDVRALQLQDGKEILEGRDGQNVAAPHGALRHGRTQTAHIADAEVGLVAQTFARRYEGIGDPVGEQALGATACHVQLALSDVGRT